MMRRTFWIALMALAFGGLPAAAQERVVFATDWRAQAEHGGFYQAIAAGLYKARGLDVTLRQGGVGMDPQQLLAAGAIDAAMGSNGYFTLNLVEAGAPVVTVAALFQKDPVILMSHDRPDVNRLADMKGKPIAVGDPTVHTIWRYLKSRYGFEDDQIRKYTFNIAPFLVNKQAIQQGYVTSEPLTATRGGAKPKVFLLADDGYLSYAATIMVRKDLTQKRPAVVRAFVEASIEGWKQYLHGDPTAANALIKRDNPEMDDETLAYARAKLIEYGIVESGDALTLGIGAMTPERWDAFTNQMVALGLYKPGIDWRQGVEFGFLPTP
ncbi:nitrate ABC transporter substrate-binding protein [Niveispirillum lacus]|uniref:Nitrate ABC transporter substrate-binding protein n=1 Tax=Niveispirillum lacus TaxID=1981099 RepID=A0A255Z8Y4_9PROT|nr:ABC transporter substrate-binding protein [Niveispirillum lacus]OYQ38013.1 nitrate ABC transporter substrate-binding protein [Niveispirillum lacus]